LQLYKWGQARSAENYPSDSAQIAYLPNHKQINGYSFKPLSFRVVCYPGVDDWHIMAHRTLLNLALSVAFAWCSPGFLYPRTAPSVLLSTFLPSTFAYSTSSRSILHSIIFLAKFFPFFKSQFKCQRNLFTQYTFSLWYTLFFFKHLSQFMKTMYSCLIA
jgi:hypothetical protein